MLDGAATRRATAVERGKDDPSQVEIVAGNDTAIFTDPQADSNSFELFSWRKMEDDRGERTLGEGRAGGYK